MNARVVLRADADEKIGVGHAMRGFALAQALVDQHVDVILATTGCGEGMLRRFADEHVPVRSISAARASADDANATAALAGHGDWVVVDGYAFDAAYLLACAARGASVLVVDDDAARAPIAAQALLNPNLHADAQAYRDWRCEALLLGTRFTPMRREFRTASTSAARDGRRLLLTMGGSDPAGLTLSLLEPLARGLHDIDIDIEVVVGAANSALSLIVERAAALPRVNVLADVRNMSEVMRRSTIAISASGSTAWELASTQVPMLLVSLAANQRPVAAAMAARGAAIDLGGHEALATEDVLVAVRSLLDDPSRARALVARAHGIVDGRGALRVARYLRTGTLASGEME